MDNFIAAAIGGVGSIPAEKWVLILRAFTESHEDTWALSPICGYDNKLQMVRVVVELLRRTVGGSERPRSPSLGLEAEGEALLAARILLRERPGSEQLMDDQAIELYVQAAREDGDRQAGFRVSLMALKCLNNAIWDQPAGQVSFVRLKGPEMVINLLQASRPTSVLYFACRIFNVIGTSNPSALTALKKRYDLLHILSSVLAWCVRSEEPPFPQGEERVKLMIQVLQGLFLLGVRYTAEERGVALRGDAMKRLGFVLMDALHLDHAELDVFAAKLQVLNLLLDMPDGFGDVLVEYGCLPRILQAVELQLVRQAFQEGETMDAAAELTPALLVLNKLVLASEDTKIAIKEAIFPPEADKVWKERLDTEAKMVRMLMGYERDQIEKTIKDRRVHPVDAPRDSLRARLFDVMTATESSSKTAGSDLLFNLCSNEEEFTTRCGFGNAVNVLRLKGRIAMPGV